MGSSDKRTWLRGKKFQNKRTIVGIGKDDCIGMEKTVPMTAVKLFQGEMKTNWN